MWNNEWAAIRNAQNCSKQWEWYTCNILVFLQPFLGCHVYFNQHSPISVFKQVFIWNTVWDAFLLYSWILAIIQNRDIIFQIKNMTATFHVTWQEQLHWYIEYTTEESTMEYYEKKNQSHSRLCFHYSHHIAFICHCMQNISHHTSASFMLLIRFTLRPGYSAISVQLCRLSCM